MRRIIILLAALPLLAVAQTFPSETTTLPAPTTVNVSDLAQYELANPPVLIARDFESDEDEKEPINKFHTVTTTDAENTVKFEYDFSANRAVSPAPTANFNGIDDNGASIPPDVNGAAGPNHFMVTLNTQYRIMSKTGTVTSTVTADAFWAGTGGTNPNTFDPKILYDSYNNRWVLVSCANGGLSSSALLVAVSQTNDPTGTWNRFLIDADAANINWFDYPSLGINKDWIVVSGNMFTNAANSYSGGKIWVLNKTNAYAGNTTGLTTINAGTSVFTLCPAITYDNALATVYLVQEYNSNSGGNAFLEVYTLTGATPTLASAGTCSTNLPYNWDGTTGAPQTGSANKIATNDSRIQSVVYRGGSLYIAHNIYMPLTSPTRNSVQWWKVNASTRAVQQAGRVDDATGTTHYCFPSIMANSAGDVMLAYSQFSGSTYASSAYSLRYAADPINTMNTSYVYKSGANTYYKTYGGTSNRWGDYSQVSLDPDGSTFWAVTEYARSTVNTWGTWVAKVVGTVSNPCATAPTGLTASSITNTSATVAWNTVTNAVSYNLQYKTSASSTWTTVNTTSTSYGLTGLTANTTYNYKVQAVCSSTSSAYSTASNFTTTAACATAPTGLTASSITSTSVTLGWTAASGATSYNIQYKLSSGSTWTTTTSATNSVNISGLTASSAYDYKVQAVCSASSSAYSSVANFTTLAVPCSSAPTGLTASSITSTGVTLGWTAASGATSYNIQYKTAAGSTWTTTTSATNSKVLTGLISNTTYNFKVQAVCSASSSAYSSIANFTTLAPSCSDVGESNNTLATASALALNTNLTALIASASDLDYYVFTTTAVQNLTITLSNLPADYDMKLYNSAGTQVGSSRNAGTTTEVMSYVNAPAGSYKVYVYGYSSAFNATSCYTLNATAAAASNCTNSNEPNESLAAAKAITPNIDIKGQIATTTDKDYYKVTLTSASSLIASIKTLPADYDLVVYNASGVQLGSSANVGTVNETVAIPNVAAGTYYFYISGYNGALSTSSCYTFKVAVANGSFSPVDNNEGMVEEIVKDDIQLVPNPASQKVTVFYTHNADEVVRLKLFDQTGREVRVYNVGLMNRENKFDLDLTDLSNGMYIVQMQGNNWVKSQKLVVVGQ